MRVGLKRSLAAWLVISLAVLTSTWLGHTLEYLRLRGADGTGQQLLGSVHAYMLPLALVLEILVILAMAAFYRAWRALGVRIQQAEAAIALAWRGKYPDLSGRPLRPIRAITGRSLWMMLAPVELALYVIQENVEAMRIGLGAPGLGVVTGVHWPAIFVHMAILLILCNLLAAALHMLVKRARGVDQVERLVRLIGRRLRRQNNAPRLVPVWLATPIQRFGRHLWRRPPPLLRLSVST
ncbi:MAG TPA: hypothetical protein VG329_06345 [Candidatus Dormibacteraeota bacterium]|jgi:hypothetical protein|nr:hypothetical protein [Candidatus Dormibacteraeota bacterium]